jgi:hypothetical protein
MTSSNKQIMTGILIAILVLLAIAFVRDRSSAKRAFREGFDSTAASTRPTP